jgi:protoheme IX farnesyltransferase
MLPVTHGVPFTCVYIVLYTILLVLASMLPFFTGMSGPLYALGAIVLDTVFARKVLLLNELQTEDAGMHTFAHSINYLVLLFTFLLADHYCRLT